MHIVNVEGAVVRDGRYLLVIRGDGETHAAGMLSLIGGKVEDDTGTLANVFEETVRREILEEVGVQIGALEYVESNAFLADDGDSVVDVVFLCHYGDGEPTVGDPAEVAAIHWLTAAEVERWRGAPPWTRRSIARAEQKRLALGW